MNTAVAFDLDGTITCEEILPLIAAELGLEREMRVLTELTLSGAIAFEDSFRLRCAALRSVSINKVRSIVDSVQLSPAIVEFIQQNSERCFVVTGNLDVWVAPILKRLGCGSFTSIARHENGQLLGLTSVLTKSDAIDSLRDQFERIVAVGDSVNDLPMFEAADVRVAFGGVHDPADGLYDVADFVTYEENSLCRLLNTL